ncbi:MAG: type II CAAX endopeptidase family protein [Methanocellales archaeon]|nr:type II CAAX endopeptidase family protein [Methanocellales archaeon]
MVKQNKSENRNLLLFFLIAFGFTWLFWVPEALAMRGLLGSSILVDFLISTHNPAAWGPFVSAFLLTWWNERRRGVIRLLKRGVEHKFAKVWWAPLILIFPIIYGGALLLAILVGDTVPELFWTSDPFSIVFYFFVVLLFQGPLQEEFGWRGYALDRIQARFSALNSSIILGVMWALWHIPYFWIGKEAIYAYTFLPFILSAILITILMTWLYNNTGGSLLVALIFHTMFNYSAQIFPVLETQQGGFFYLILFISIVIAVVIIAGPKRLVREKFIKTTSLKSF